MHVGLANRMDFSVFMSTEVSIQVMLGLAKPRTRKKRFISNLVFTVPMYLGDLVTNRPKLFTMTASPRLNFVRKQQKFLIVK